MGWCFLGGNTHTSGECCRIFNIHITLPPPHPWFVKYLFEKGHTYTEAHKGSFIRLQRITIQLAVRVLLPKPKLRRSRSAKIFRCLTPNTFSGTGISDCLLWPRSRTVRYTQYLAKVNITDFKHMIPSLIFNGKQAIDSFSIQIKCFSHYLERSDHS